MRTRREAGIEGLWKSAGRFSGQYPFLKMDSEMFDRFGDQKVNKKGSLVLLRCMSGSPDFEKTYLLHRGTYESGTLWCQPVKIRVTKSSNLVEELGRGCTE